MLSRAHFLLAFALPAVFPPAARAQSAEERAPITGFPEIVLRDLPPIDLRAADGPPPPIRNLCNFCFLDEHRLAVLSWDQRLLVVTDRGEIQRELHLPQLELPLGPLRVRLGQFSKFARTGPERVILAPEAAWNEGALRARGLLEIDFAQGTMRIPALVPDSEYGVSLAGSPAGEFALLVRPNSETTELLVFDPDGSLSWSRKKRVCAASSLCFTSSGQVALLDAEAAAVQRFRWRGWWSTYTPIRFPAGGPFQPYAIDSAPGGDLAFLCMTPEFAGGAAIVRTDDDLEALRLLEPRHSEGTPIQRAVHASPAGRLWACDHDSISRLGPDGLAELTLGIAPEEHKLGEARAVQIDRADHIFAIARRDGAVHEFDASGKRVRVTPMTGQLRRERSRDGLPPGFEDVFAWRLHASFGERTWTREWNEGAERLRLLDRAGSVLVERALQHEDELAGPAPDGSLVWLRAGSDERPFAATRLDLEGAELAHWDLPQLSGYLESADFDGRCLVIALPDRIVAWHADGRPWFNAAIPYSCSHMGCGMSSSSCWRVHLARDGRELWLRRGTEATTIERYALP